MDVTTVDDVMAIKPKILASMGYHIFLIFLTMVLGARGAPLIKAVTRDTSGISRTKSIKPPTSWLNRDQLSSERTKNKQPRSFTLRRNGLRTNKHLEDLYDDC